MKPITSLGVVFALAAHTGAWAQAIVDITTPDSHEGVPLNGSSANLPFSAKLRFVSPYYYCGGASYTWTRDQVDPKQCSDNSCSVSYQESSSTRGPHQAQMEATYFWGYAPNTQCYPGWAAANRSYVVQYAPTVSITGAPWTLRVGEPGQFSAAGTLDPDYAVNNALSYSWTFGDGGGASGASVTHAWTQCGDYFVRVTASDGALTATAMTQVTVTSYNCTVKIK